MRYWKCGNKHCPKGEIGIMCGNKMCPKYEGMDECLSVIESDYYFHLSFENTYGEDYVSEKFVLYWKEREVSLIIFDNI